MTRLRILLSRLWSLVRSRQMDREIASFCSILLWDITGDAHGLFSRDNQVDGNDRHYVGV
jgi:hypothetical protein